MTTERGLQGALHSWLHEDRHEDATRVLHTVLDGVPTHPQHRPRWSVMTPGQSSSSVAWSTRACSIGSRVWAGRVVGWRSSRAR